MRLGNARGWKSKVVMRDIRDVGELLEMSACRHAGSDAVPGGNGRRQCRNETQDKESFTRSESSAVPARTFAFVIVGFGQLQILRRNEARTSVMCHTRTAETSVDDQRLGRLQFM